MFRIPKPVVFLAIAGLMMMLTALILLPVLPL